MALCLTVYTNYTELCLAVPTQVLSDQYRMRGVSVCSGHEEVALGCAASSSATATGWPAGNSVCKDGAGGAWGE